MPQQQLKVEATISIPADYVLIKRVEYEELQHSSLSGVCWTMQDLEKRLGRRSGWIKDNILFKFRKILDIEYGGFVTYPKSQGQSWLFHAEKMAGFIDKHFNLIFKVKEA